MQAYFLDRFDARDMKSIQELVRVFCKNYSMVPEGQVLINAILAGEPEEYLESSILYFKPMIIKVFAEDMAVHRAELKDIRKISYPITDAFSEHKAETPSTARE